MSRTVRACSLVPLAAILWLSTAPAGWSQTNASPAAPGRDRRLEDALVDVAILKRVVKEQDRRIADLEKLVKALQASGAAGIITERPLGEERARVIVKPSPARWLNPLSWGQLREGLSRAQVEEILGKPTAVESVIDSQTLVYKSDGARTLTGTIKLIDDRVFEVIPPEF